jgi:cytochrome P450
MEPSLPLNARMSDAEVIATIQTFVLAGAETSSTALTWGSWVLAKMPQVQDALRKECEAVLEDEPSMSVFHRHSSSSMRN